MEERAFLYFHVESMEPMGAIWLQTDNLQSIRWLFSDGHSLPGAGENLWEPGERGTDLQRKSGLPSELTIPGLSLNHKNDWDLSNRDSKC